jgi:hypothetical protein
MGIIEVSLRVLLGSQLLRLRIVVKASPCREDYLKNIDKDDTGIIVQR